MKLAGCSWNVAGLTTTVQRVETHYKSLSNFFRLHHADIVCLQEHKISRATLVDRSDRRILLDGEQYESYWSCCTDANKKGFNGVMTYVSSSSKEQQASTVVSASSTPLGVPHLDRLGRCLRTDHQGNFSIFNVYAPCSSIRGGYQLDLKMEFLTALRKAMQQQRDQGRAVILVGDLNIAAGTEDVHRNQCVIYVDEILRLSSTDDSLPAWQQDIQEHWPRIQAVLEKRETVSTQTVNSMTGVTYDKFRVCVKDDSHRTIWLGQHETTAEYASRHYDFSACTYTDPATGKENVLSCAANAIPVTILIELFQKLVVGWKDSTGSYSKQQAMIQSAVAERNSPPRLWLQSVVENDGFVDTFRHYYPTAQDRFTCWNQNKNCRYSNDGARIDYILMDKGLLSYLRPGTPPMLTKMTCTTDNANEQDAALDPFSTQAALQAVTANGGYRPAGFGGGGMDEATKATLDTQFAAGPRTGHIYTPPTFSDHVAVSAVLEAVPCLEASSTKDADGCTKKAQPHRQQRSVASFFTKKNEPGSQGPKRPLRKVQKPAVQPKKKKTLLDHFAKR